MSKCTDFQLRKRFWWTCPFDIIRTCKRTFMFKRKDYTLFLSQNPLMSWKLFILVVFFSNWSGLVNRGENHGCYVGRESTIVPKFLPLFLFKAHYALFHPLLFSPIFFLFECREWKKQGLAHQEIKGEACDRPPQEILNWPRYWCLAPLQTGARLIKHQDSFAKAFPFVF